MNTHISYAPKFEPWDSSHWSILVLHPQGPDLSMEPWIETVHLNPPRQWNHVEPLVKPNLSDFMTNIRRDVFNTLDVFENEKKTLPCKVLVSNWNNEEGFGLVGLEIESRSASSNWANSFKVVYQAGSVTCLYVNPEASNCLQTFNLWTFYLCFFPPHLLTFQTKKKHPPPHMGTSILVYSNYTRRGPISPFSTEASAPVVRSHRRAMHVLEPRRVDVENPVNNGMELPRPQLHLMKFVSFCYILESFLSSWYIA